jgi:hypothetical protein
MSSKTTSQNREEAKARCIDFYKRMPGVQVSSGTETLNSAAIIHHIQEGTKTGVRLLDLFIEDESANS